MPVAAATTSDRMPQIGVDANGHLHLVFVRTAGPKPGLYYVTDASGAWAATRLTDSAGAGQPRILVAGNAKVHVFWRRSATNEADPGLFHASNETGSWVKSKIVATPDGSEILSGYAVALGPDGRPHLFFDQAQGSAAIEHYLINKSGSTFTAQAAPTVDVGGQPDLAIDSNGKAWLTYVTPGQTSSSDDLWISTNKTGAWAPTKLTNATRPKDPDVVVGPNGKVFVAFAEAYYTADGVRVYSNRTGSWTDVEASTSYLSGPDLAVRANGDIVVVGWKPNPYSDITYAVVKTNSKTEDVIAGGQNQDKDDPTLALDPDEASHVAFSANLGSGYELRYLANVGGTWDTVIDASTLLDTAGTFKADIDWLVAEAITAGCSRNFYCPSDPVTREQMAIFLDRALKLPATTTDYFSDDTGRTGEAAINRVAAAGITSGCATGKYCPGDKVTRGAMASFLARAFALPYTATDYFIDDNGTTHEANINRVKVAGITSGCTPTTYCPDATVTRGQMAAFLHRALGD